MKKAKIVPDTKVKVKPFKLSLWNRLKEKYLKRFTDEVMIEMIHLNGSVSHVVLLKKDHKFIYNGNEYILDEDRKIWNNSSRNYMFRFHEGFALPFSLDISSNNLKKGVREHDAYENDLIEIETSFNPFVLKDVLKMEYAKGVIQGAEVSEQIKRMFFMIIIILIGVLSHFLVNAMKSGWI